MPAPVVAIIGRPNVGKSTFFNRILGERRAVVHDRPGITRDRNTARAEWTGRSFVLVDTGGFLPSSSEGRDVEVRRQAETAIAIADLVVFLVDAKTGATDLDAAIGKGLRKAAVPHLLVVNKVDKPNDPVAHEFHRLGLGDPIPISSENGTGIGDLLDEIVKRLPEVRERAEKPLGRVAIVGRPNVGKSSIVNALLGERRMIVEPRPGTTLDPIDSEWRTEHGLFLLVDTAGIRRQAQFADQAEFYAVLRALQALERADVVCLVVDVMQGFDKQDARLAHEAMDAGCTLLVLYNKWDLVEEREMRWKEILAARASKFPTLADLPSMPLSATSGLHLHRLSLAIEKRLAEHRRKVPTAKLNDWLKGAQRERAVPSTRAGHAPRIYYATQTGIGPPEITLFVNHPSKLSDNYRRYLHQHFCRTFEFEGVPVRMRVRKSE